MRARSRGRKVFVFLVSRSETILVGISAMGQAGGQPSPGGIVYPLGSNKRFLLIPIQLHRSPGFAWRTEPIARGSRGRQLLTDLITRKHLSERFLVITKRDGT